MNAPGASRQSGVALMSVLLIVAIVSALVYHLVERHSLVVAQTRATLFGDQSLAYALGAEAFARQILFDDWAQEESRGFDALTEPWAQPLEPFEIESGFLELWIEDLQGRFNLNALSGNDATRAHQRLREMLSAAGLQPEIADLWKDWVDGDDEVSGFGAEDGDYLLAEPPHRAANQQAAHVSELRWLKDVDAETYDALVPLVATLPDARMRINVNTARAPALVAISARLPPTKAESLVESPRQFTTIEAVHAEIPEFSDAGDALAVTSDFFQIHARAEVNGARTDLASTVYRDPTTGQITLLGRDLGRRFVSRFIPVEENDS